MKNIPSISLFLLAIALVPLSCKTASNSYLKIGRNQVTRVRYAATLGPGDVFLVRVYREKDLSGLFRVPPSGVIDFPLIGPLNVVGLTPSSLALRLRTRLKKGYIKDPWVSVYVKQYNSKKITVVGQVKKPGTYRYEQDMHIIQAISLAGGFTNIAQKNYIIVTRRQLKGKETRIPVPVENISKGLARNFFIKPGDIIFVPETVL